MPPMKKLKAAAKRNLQAQISGEFPVHDNQPQKEMLSFLKNVLSQLIPAGYAQFFIDFQHNVFQPPHGNAELLCDFCIRNAVRYQQSDMVFPQGQYERDVVLGELVVERDPVLPRLLPLTHNGRCNNRGIPAPSTVPPGLQAR